MELFALTSARSAPMLSCAWTVSTTVVCFCFSNEGPSAASAGAPMQAIAIARPAASNICLMDPPW
jgi:hypothetical protein